MKIDKYDQKIKQFMETFDKKTCVTIIVHRKKEYGVFANINAEGSLQQINHVKDNLKKHIQSNKIIGDNSVS